MEVCTWEKITGKYQTSCGHKPVSHGRGWVYCPFCGKISVISKADYQRRYAKKNKEQRKAYYRAYYQEHK